MRSGRPALAAAESTLTAIQGPLIRPLAESSSVEEKVTLAPSGWPVSRDELPRLCGPLCALTCELAGSPALAAGYPVQRNGVPWLAGAVAPGRASAARVWQAAGPLAERLADAVSGPAHRGDHGGHAVGEEPVVGGGEGEAGP